MAMKKTTVLMDEQLLKEAMKAVGAKTKKEAIRARLDALDTIDCSLSLWEKAYRLAFKLRCRGITVPYTDILIAACALKVGATIVHPDVHFDLLQKPADLKVESYVNHLT